MKRVARGTLERRLRVAENAADIALTQKVSIRDACQQMGLSRSYLDSTIREWRHGWIVDDSKPLAVDIINYILEVNNTSHGGISKYKSWEDIEAASNKSVELFREHWPDDKERAEFNKKFGKYWTGHSDEIYREFPKFRK